MALTGSGNGVEIEAGRFRYDPSLAFVQAKLASPRPVAARQRATPPPPPPPEGMSMPMKIGIGVGALIVIIIIASRAGDERAESISSRDSRQKKAKTPEEISLTPQSALLACRRFFGERDEVPWSFKWKFDGSGTFTSNERANRFGSASAGRASMTKSGPCSSVGRARPW